MFSSTGNDTIKEGVMEWRGGVYRRAVEDMVVRIVYGLISNHSWVPVQTTDFAAVPFVDQ